MGKARPAVVEFTGKCGNVIYYMFKDKLCCRSMPESYNNPRTKKQQVAWSRFRKLNTFCRNSMDDINKKIWDTGDKTRTHQQSFTHFNSPVLDKEGNITFYEKLTFSFGQLNFPSLLSISLCNDSAGIIKVEWADTDTENPFSPTDRLRIIAINNGELSIIPRLIAFRRDNWATFPIPWESWDTLHIYAFFYDEYLFTSTATYYETLINPQQHLIPVKSERQPGNPDIKTTTLETTVTMASA